MTALNLCKKTAKSTLQYTKTVTPLTWVGHSAFSDQFCQQDTEGPDVRLDGEAPVQGSLGGGPLNGELGSCKPGAGWEGGRGWEGWMEGGSKKEGGKEGRRKRRAGVREGVESWCVGSQEREKEREGGGGEMGKSEERILDSTRGHQRARSQQGVPRPRCDSSTLDLGACTVLDLDISGLSKP